jgi:hypothetical protein
MPRTYSFDVKMQLDDGAAARVASGIGQVGGSNSILYLGGLGDVRTDLGIVGATVSRGDFACVVNIASIATATDGNYKFSIMGSQNASGANPVVLGEQTWGLGTVIPNGAAGSETTGAGSTTQPGRRELMFATEMNGIYYDYVYAYLTVSGATSKSVQYSAYVAKLPLT